MPSEFVQQLNHAMYSSKGQLSWNKENVFLPQANNKIEVDVTSQYV